MLCGSLDRRESGGGWIHVYVGLSPFVLHLKLSQHCLLTGYMPIQNKVFFFLIQKTVPSSAVGTSLIPCQGAQIPHALWPKNRNIQQKHLMKTLKWSILKGILKKRCQGKLPLFLVWSSDGLVQNCLLPEETITNLA